MPGLKKHFWVVSIFLGLLYAWLFGFLRWSEHDLPSVEAGTKLLAGLEGGQELQGRLSKPFALLIPAILLKLFGVHPVYALVGINFSAFVFSALGVWKLVLKETSDFIIAASVLILFLTCQPLAVYSFLPMADIQGICIVIWLMVYFSKSTITNVGALFAGLLTGFGILFKENVIIFPVYFIFLNLFVSKKINKNLFIFLGGLIIPVLIAGIWTTVEFGTNILTRTLETTRHFPGYSFSYYYLQQWARVFDMHIVWLFAGMVFLFRIIKIKFWIIGGTLLAVFLLLPLLGAYCHDRVMMLVLPCLIPVFTSGLQVMGKLAFYPVSIGGALNIFITWKIYAQQSEGLLIPAFLSFIVIWSGFLMIKKNVSPTP